MSDITPDMMRSVATLSKEPDVREWLHTAADEIERLRQRVAELDRGKQEWQPIDTAPRDGTTIIGWCDHEADPYFDESGRRLTPYGSNAEGMSHAPDGANMIYWHAEIDEGEYIVPAWWCVADDYGEIAANPTHWMPLPEPPEES